MNTIQISFWIPVLVYIYSFERGAVIVRLALVFLLEKFRHRKNVRLLSIGTGILKLVNLR